MSKQYSIQVSISEQTLLLLKGEEEVKSYRISSAANGIGTEEGSYCTPTGNFYIDEKHGYGAPINTIFKGRQPKGIWRGEKDTGDLVLTRVLWLQGLDDDNGNTKQRYIYIHGTNHEDKLGAPHSCGCIRMNNTDVIELYDLVGIGTKVTISR